MLPQHVELKRDPQNKYRRRSSRKIKFGSKVGKMILNLSLSPFVSPGASWIPLNLRRVLSHILLAPLTWFAFYQLAISNISYILQALKQWYLFWPLRLSKGMSNPCAFPTITVILFIYLSSRLFKYTGFRSRSTHNFLTSSPLLVTLSIRRFNVHSLT